MMEKEGGSDLVLHELPVDILASIFSLCASDHGVTTLARVNRRFYTIIKQVTRIHEPGTPKHFLVAHLSARVWVLSLSNYTIC